MTLAPDDFSAFMSEVHGYPPFAWQQRLVEHVAERGRWPGTLDIPTGLGKTSALDVAVFTLAMSESGASQAPLPRRVFMVIDRRVVVDQSFSHAETIGRALRHAEVDSVTARVAKALTPPPIVRHDGDQDARIPLVVGRMRGGATWAWRWLERPDQPAIVVGTIDQLGSRLLFDGYGVGEFIRPIDAALTGADSLVLIDEAHLAEPFLTTLADALAMAKAREPLPIGETRVVVMSATSSSAPEPRFAIDEKVERRNDFAARRLDAPKSLVTAQARVAKKRRAVETAQALAVAARQLGETHDVVGVIANTIAVARAAFEELRGPGPVDGERAVLITGRQRAVDRQLLWDRWRERIEAGRSPQDGPLFVVATQTIEVGADLDFSGLVSESASIDALVQRLGRLNRRGDWETSTAVVVHPSVVDDDDPIYGPARAETWSWLSSLTSPNAVIKRGSAVDLTGAIDVSPAAIAVLLDEHRDRVLSMRMQVPRTPVLFPATLDRWVRTSPRGLDASPTGPFLHGIDRDLPSVSVLWRHARRDDVDHRQVRDDLSASVEALPPSPDEVVEVPVWSIDSWLHDHAEAGDVGDIDTVARQPEARHEPFGELPLIVIGVDGQSHALSLPIRSGTTIVAPTWFGGLDLYGWHPGSREPVVDVADLAEHRVETGGGRRRRQVLRLDPATLAPLMGAVVEAELTPIFKAAKEAVEAGDKPGDIVEQLLDDLGVYLDRAESQSRYIGLLAAVMSAIRGDRKAGVVAFPLITDVHAPMFLAHRSGAIERWSNDQGHASTSMSGQPVTLDAHQRAVAERADAFARSLGLPDDVRSAVVTAAAHHDVGKLDPRFQRMLNGGGVAPQTPLAKSGMDPAQHWMFARSRQLAGYPSGMRHEAHSARAVAALYADHPERELIVHLVAAHHGRARPLEAAVDDPEPETRYRVASEGRSVEVRSGDGPDWDQPRRFRLLNERFGPWGLAMLETIVRLADIGCSSEGS